MPTPRKKTPQHLIFTTFALLGALFALWHCSGSVEMVPTEYTPVTGADGSALLCQPGQGKCEGQVAMQCRADGMGWTKLQTCTPPAACHLGSCKDPCAVAQASRSYVGCEYFAVDLDNVPSSQGYSPQNAQFAIVVSNAGTTGKAVGVKIYSKASGSEQVVAQGTVAAGAIKTFNVGPQNIKGTFKGTRAFRVVSEAPVTVYQFNPLNNTKEAFSNDASLLLPVASLDNDYIAVTGNGLMVGDVYDPKIQYESGSFVTVVATQENTKVTITPTAAIRAGSGIPGGKAPVTRTLQRYEVLSVSSVVDELSTVLNATNLSGTTVKADKPVAVFVGNAATLVPTGFAQQCCADHLEEQMIPLSAWGKVFVAAHTRPRVLKGLPEVDWWRITGGANGVTLSYEPVAPFGAPTKLSRGQTASFASGQSFVVKASGPILVTQFMASAQNTGQTTQKACTSDSQCKGFAFEAACHMGFCGPVGDPAMILFPPVEQYRKDYVFLVPNDYYIDYATLIVPVGAQLKMDGKAISTKAQAIGSIDGIQYGYLHVSLTDGQHRAEGNKPFGVLAYGLDAYVSYGYVAGLNLKRINIL